MSVSHVLAAEAQQLPSNTSVSPPTDWYSLVQEITKTIPGFKPGPGFQILPVVTEAGWLDQKYGNYYLWQLLGNTIPRWGSVYYASPFTVTEGYFIFLTNLDIPASNQEQTKKALSARAKYISTHRAITALLADKSSYDKGVLKSDRAKHLDQLQHQEQNYAQLYSSFLVKSLSGFAEAGNLLPDYDNPAYQEEALSPDGLTLTYRTFNVTPDLSQWVSESSGKPAVVLARAELGEHFHLASPASSLGMDINKTNTPTKDLNSLGTVQGAKTADNLANTLTESSFSKVSVSARRVGIFRVQASPWFNGTAVKTFGNGPWLDGPVKREEVKLWGADGIFNLLPTAVIVLYDPSVQLTVKTGQLEGVKASIQSSAAVKFGPFEFGASYVQQNHSLTLDERKGTVQLSFPGPGPYIIAVVNCVLPNCD